MYRLAPYSLWLGNVGDIRDLRRVLAEGVRAVIDLAANEPPAFVTREIVYCRFPLLDGAGNPPWIVRAAVQMLVELLEAHVPTLVYCGAGMSRSPAIVAAALTRLNHRPLDDNLTDVLDAHAADVSSALWSEVKSLMEE